MTALGFQLLKKKKKQELSITIVNNIFVEL